MFRTITRNKKQILSKDRAMQILSKGTSGVLSLLDEDGYTYGVPLSYSLHNGKIYFHCAKKGHKIDAVKNHNKVSFTVIETDQIVPEAYTTYFRSVIVFGTIALVDDADQKREALHYLVEKYSSDYIDGSKDEIESKLNAVQILVLDIEHVSGKEAIEFAEADIRQMM